MDVWFFLYSLPPSRYRLFLICSGSLCCACMSSSTLLDTQRLKTWPLVLLLTLLMDLARTLASSVIHKAYLSPDSNDFQSEWVSIGREMGKKCSVRGMQEYAGRGDHGAHGHTSLSGSSEMPWRTFQQNDIIEGSCLCASRWLQHRAAPRPSDAVYSVGEFSVCDMLVQQVVFLRDLKATN